MLEAYCSESDESSEFGRNISEFFSNFAFWFNFTFLVFVSSGISGI